MDDNNSDKLDILRKLDKNPSITQRKLAKELGFSLGKLNYCMKSLRDKGLVKIQNFSKNKNKFNPHSKANYLYILTPKGLMLKTKLTIKFMKIKIQEYDELKEELKK